MIDETYDQAEEREAQRLAEVLQAMEDGTPAPISAFEDPELASLVETASLLRGGLASTTESASFHSYRARSRAYILHTLEAQHRDAPRQPQPARIVPFVSRRRLAVFGSVAVAATIAGFALFSSPADAPTGSANAPVAAANLTAASTDAELARIQQAIALLSAQAERGEPIGAPVLRTITENTAAVANKIDTSPGLVSREHVATYRKTLTEGTAVLTSVQPSAGSENALAAAQRATQDGVVAAARYLGADETPTVTPSATATPAPSATATSTPATATPTATKPPTPAPSATPVATSTPPAASPTPTATEGTVRP